VIDNRSLRAHAEEPEKVEYFLGDITGLRRPLQFRCRESAYLPFSNKELAR
jgi:hypothetical protein